VARGDGQGAFLHEDFPALPKFDKAMATQALSL
jgi:hypothetical protein